FEVQVATDPDAVLVAWGGLAGILELDMVSAAPIVRFGGLIWAVWAVWGTILNMPVIASPSEASAAGVGEDVDGDGSGAFVAGATKVSGVEEDGVARIGFAANRAGFAANVFGPLLLVGFPSAAAVAVASSFLAGSTRLPSEPNLSCISV